MPGFCIPMICIPTIDKISISKVSALNVQDNKLTQINDQLGRVTTMWGEPTINNRSTQNAGSKQLGTATNNLNVSSTAWKSLVDVKKIDATSAQTNDTVQASTQKGISVSGWYDPINNTSTQNAGNYQWGSATNNINIWA